MKKIKVIKRYSDVLLKKIVKEDTTMDVEDARAEHLVKEGVAVILEDAKKEGDKKETAK